MSISLVIPTLRLGDKLEKCLDSLEGEYDELIIIDDKEDNLAVKINKGLRQATKDYIVVSNDDIELVRGSLSDLCRENLVVSPTVIGGINKTFHAHIWCMSRELYKKAVGVVRGWSDYGKPGYYEGFYRFYWDDTDYEQKLLANGFEVVRTEDVVVNHNHPGFTLGTFQDNGKTDINQQIFYSRWS